jgi:S1-C subfamily serine protease
MKLLLLPFLALFSFFHSHETPYSEMVNKVQASILRVTGQVDIMQFDGGKRTGDFVCSGEVIAQDRVLTAAHCTHTTYPIKADGVVVTVLKVDDATDLAIFQVSTSKPALVMREAEVVRFEPLTGIGYAYGLSRLTALAVRPFLLDQFAPFRGSEGSAPGILVQPSYIGGMSGGPVVDEYGQMVGIVQQGYDGVGYGVGTLIIRAFLLGV